MVFVSVTGADLLIDDATVCKLCKSIDCATDVETRGDTTPTGATTVVAISTGTDTYPVGGSPIDCLADVTGYDV